MSLTSKLNEGVEKSTMTLMMKTLFMLNKSTMTQMARKLSILTFMMNPKMEFLTLL